MTCKHRRAGKKMSCNEMAVRRCSVRTEGGSHLSRAIRHTGESVGARNSSQTQLVNAKSTLLSHKRMVAKPCVFILYVDVMVDWALKTNYLS